MRLTVVDAEKCVGCQCCMFACTRRQGKAGLSQSCLLVRSANGMAHGFEVVICHACTDPQCARVCPTNALTVKPGGGVRLEPGKCVGCGNCRSACIIGAVFWDDQHNQPVICVQCGYCVRYCPYGIIALEKPEAARAQG